jgi:3-dehydroquinate synthase
MGQADAAIGGKTAINLGKIKNQIGFFHAAKAVFIFPEFLKTLPVAHLRAGLAEIIKMALISDASVWRRLLKHPVSKLIHKPVESKLWLTLIAGAVKYKNRVVMHDYRERKLRKSLNFGHTIGHALEGYSQMRSGSSLLHGEAVAAGMICASYLSHRKTGLPAADLEAIQTYLAEGFGADQSDALSMLSVMELMMHDKKKSNGHLLFTLISKPGKAVIGVPCEQNEILEALNFYNTVLSGCQTP